MGYNISHASFTKGKISKLINKKNVKIFGPAPAPIYFLRGRFRRRFLIKSDKNVNIQDVILNWTRKTNIPNHIKLTIDIDPFSFM